VVHSLLMLLFITCYFEFLFIMEYICAVRMLMNATLLKMVFLSMIMVILQDLIMFILTMIVVK